PSLSRSRRLFFIFLVAPVGGDTSGVTGIEAGWKVRRCLSRPGGVLRFRGLTFPEEGSEASRT
ncbi:MAG TPA: hypothetical protein VJ848_01305, partial [Candidatus Angelobacter sp.]|nr:hypothetical protein [Candidatus Angelobacter sp.]